MIEAFGAGLLRGKAQCELRGPSWFFEGPKENLPGPPELVQSRSLQSVADLANWDVSDQHTNATHAANGPGTHADFCTLKRTGRR